jgi:hypothetical protein
VIDTKNVKAEYTGLKTGFTSNCNPAAPPPPPVPVPDPEPDPEDKKDDNAFISIGKSNLLSLLLVGLLGVELLNFF